MIIDAGIVRNEIVISSEWLKWYTVVTVYAMIPLVYVTLITTSKNDDDDNTENKVCCGKSSSS